MILFSWFIFCFYRNGRLCIWECSIDPDDLVEWKPVAKKGKLADSDSEDDIDTENIIEKTEKQKASAERKLLQSSKNISVLIYENICMDIINVHIIR